MDLRRAVGLVGLTGLVGALPLFLCSPPMRPPAHARPNAIAVASVTTPLWSAPDTRALPDVTADVPVTEARTPEPAPDCTVLRCVALTFDDGPGPYTDRLLGILRDAGVHATFFLIGQSAADYPDQVRAELAQGEEVGNHSWSHPQLTHLDDYSVAQQVQRTADLLESIDGQRPTVFRPPYGDVNNRVSQILGEQGVPGILWDVDTLDWLYRNSDSVYHRATSAVHPGSIILMHDIHPTTIPAVPRIIDELKSRGYKFVTVSQLFGGELSPGRVYSELTVKPTPTPTPTPTWDPEQAHRMDD